MDDDGGDENDRDNDDADDDGEDRKTYPSTPLHHAPQARRFLTHTGTGTSTK